jgi:hypothetical protein
LETSPAIRIAGIGRYLREHGAIDVFWLNVGRYLWEQGDHGKRFYENTSAPDGLSASSSGDQRHQPPSRRRAARWRRQLAVVSFAHERFAKGLADGSS